MVPLRYGPRAATVRVPRGKLVGIYEPRSLPHLDDLPAATRRALREPLNAPPLRQLAETARSAAILIDDVTRPVPTPELLPPVLDELAAAGLLGDAVSIIVARGVHRSASERETRALVGDPSWGRSPVYDHDPEADLEFLGETTLGTRVFLNRRFLAADLKIAVGDVEYHQFMGYGGTAKSVFPGVADAESTRLNHSRMDLDGAEPGRIEGNPVREEVDEVGRMAGLDFCLSVVLDADHHPVGCFGGEMMAVLHAGAALVDEMFRVVVPRAADVVLVSAGGAPRDVNLYQAQKAVRSATKIVRRGGKTVLVAECPEGAGSDLYVQWMREAERLDDIFQRLRERFVMGGHKAYQFARSLAWAEVWLLSAMEPERVRELKMHPLAGVEEIERLIEQAASVSVLTDGTLTLPVLASQ